MSDSILTVDKLSLAYRTPEGSLPALADVSLRIKPGETLGVVGESGCGKSSLATAILRLLPGNASLTSGRVELRGRDLLQLGREEMRRVRGKDVALISQDPVTALNPSFTVGDQLLSVLAAHEGRSPAARRRDLVIETLERVGVADAAQRINEYPHQFSGGMCQRVLIAMALMMKPALIVADEATASLDVTVEAQAIRLLRELQKEHGTSMLFISHNLGVVSEISDRVAVMYAGRVIEEGPTDQVISAPMHPYTRALLRATPSFRQRGGRLGTIPGRVPPLFALPVGCSFADRCASARDVCREAPPVLVARDERSVRCAIYDAESGYGPPADPTRADPAAPDAAASQGRGAREGEVLLRANGLKTYFSQEVGLVGRLFGRERMPVRAVDGIDFELRRGEVLGLVGESGSGKTTLGRTLLRLLSATSGEVTFAGRDLRAISGAEVRRLRRRVQMISQYPHASLSPRLRIGELLEEPYEIHRVPAQDRYDVGELLEMVEVSPSHATKYPHQLSGGQARRVGIARALALKPDLIVADEPTAGLDVSAAASVLNLMRDLGDQLGLAYVVITHDLDVVGYLAHQIAVMYLGKFVEIGRADDVLERPAHPYTRALLAAASGSDFRNAFDLDPRLLADGDVPSPRNPPSGCSYHTRCWFARDKCREERPELASRLQGSAIASCHFASEVQEILASPLRAGSFMLHEEVLGGRDG